MSFSDDDLPEPDPGVDRKMIGQFREQIHALGALWIIIGSVAIALAVVALQGNPNWAARIGGEERIVLFVIGGIGLVWFVLGVLTCLKQIWAVYVALVLSYLSLLGQVLNASICGIVILILVILQAHRVIGWASRMRAAGVPLNTRLR